MFKRKPKPERTLVTAPLNDEEFEALKADAIARHNQSGGSVSELKSQLRALEMAREQGSATQRPESPG